MLKKPISFEYVAIPTYGNEAVELRIKITFSDGTQLAERNVISLEALLYKSFLDYLFDGAKQRFESVLSSNGIQPK